MFLMTKLEFIGSVPLIVSHSGFRVNMLHCPPPYLLLILVFFLFFFIISQKIFVMPNMDDVWLPIMHSAMDTRSNANLFTVTNDALKDPEPESDVSDM